MKTRWVIYIRMAPDRVIGEIELNWGSYSDIEGGVISADTFELTEQSNESGQLK